MIGAGTFASGTGVVTLSCARTIADNTDFTAGIRTIYSGICQSGAKTLSTGTGSVTLNGDVAIARTKDFA